MSPSSTSRRPSILPNLRESMSVSRILLGGAVRERRSADDLDRALRQPLPLTCRAAIIPTTRHCGATTTALQLVSMMTRARRLPALIMSASPSPASAADHLPGSGTWPADESFENPRTSAQAQDLIGTAPDGLTSCLRLPQAASPSEPHEWASARRRLVRFFDIAMMETGPMAPELMLELARHHHVIILVSPARRAEMERDRKTTAALRQHLTSHGQATGSRVPRLIHAVNTTSPRRPLIPALQPEERFIPYDTVLASTGPDRTRGAGVLNVRTARALAAIASDIVSSATPTPDGRTA